jgi:outer membrane protein TolC
LKRCRIAKQRREGGLSNYLDVLSAGDVLLSSQRMFSEMLSRTFMLDVALVRALGGGYQVAKPETSQPLGGTK